jgi:hypothetical protein
MFSLELNFGLHLSVGLLFRTLILHWHIFHLVSRHFQPCSSTSILKYNKVAHLSPFQFLTTSEIVPKSNEFPLIDDLKRVNPGATGATVKTALSAFV